jgi:hypothetical protein
MRMRRWIGMEMGQAWEEEDRSFSVHVRKTFFDFLNSNEDQVN